MRLSDILYEIDELKEEIEMHFDNQELAEGAFKELREGLDRLSRNIEQTALA